MASEKTIFYDDELNDDFAPSNGKIDALEINDKYGYLHCDPIWRMLAFILYRFVATPIAFCFMKLCFGMKIKNRSAVRNIKGGYFLYGNHTQGAADAFIPTFLTFPRKANIVTSADAVSIPIIKYIVPMLGAIPLASTVRGKLNYLNALKEKLGSGQAVVVYPEAHIWPYCNRIRRFSDASFIYPIKFDVPAVGFTVTYRQRKIFKSLPPLITVTLSEPVYPSQCADRTEIRDRIYNFMEYTVNKEKSFAYRKYIKRANKDDSNNSV